MIHVAELDAVALVLRISELRDTGRNLGATLAADGHRGVEIAPVALRNSEPDLGVPRRSFPVPQADRTPFALVRGQQFGATDTAKHRRQLPSEVHSVADPGVHAITTGRDILVDGVASEKYPPPP